MEINNDEWKTTKIFSFSIAFFALLRRRCSAPLLLCRAECWMLGVARYLSLAKCGEFSFLLHNSNFSLALECVAGGATV